VRTTPLSSVFVNNTIHPTTTTQNINNNSINHNGPPILDNINWNLDAGVGPGAMLGGSSGIDDIDMDFSTLFDSEEQLLVEGGGGLDVITAVP